MIELKNIKVEMNEVGNLSNAWFWTEQLVVALASFPHMEPGTQMNLGSFFLVWC